MIKFFIFICICLSNVIAQSEFNLINKNQLIYIDKILSSPEFEGRLSGSAGYDKASELAKGIMLSNNLKPAFGENFYQHFNVEYNQIHEPNILNCYIDNQETVFKLGDDFVYRGFTGSTDFRLPVAFVGYGLSQPEINFDEYANVDVKNKIVIAFKYNPKWNNKNGNWQDGSPRNKAANAYKHGAKGILFVSTPNESNPQKTIGSILDGDGKQMNNFPSLHISIEAANKFLSGTNYNLNQLQSIIDSTQKPFSIGLKSEAEIFVKNTYIKDQPTQNIAGIWEGSDEALKNKFIVVGAHLDHVGKQGNIYFPGANDNASGSSVVLNMIKYFGENKIKTKSSVIFVLFASEEIGLYGSKYFVENLPVPKENIICMFNFDCVGFGDSIQVGGGKSSPLLWDLIKNVGSQTTKMLVKNTWNGGGADAEYFYRENIPTAYFVTTNSYKHLHYMTDTVETLNQELFAAVANLGLSSLLKIANGEYQKEIVIKN